MDAYALVDTFKSAEVGADIGWGMVPKQPIDACSEFSAKDLGFASCEDVAASSLRVAF